MINHDANVICAKFSNDGKMIATGSGDKYNFFKI